MSLNSVLTLAVVNMDESVALAQCLRDNPNEPLGPIRYSVDGDETKGTLRRRHGDDDDDANCKNERQQECNIRGAFIFH